MKIGVIGGNGVAATNRLCDMIERKLTAKGAFRDAHHPELIVWQATSVPSRSMFLEGRGPDWRPQYIQIAKEFKRLGCDFGCMCCNTAHYAISDVEEGAGLKFINILEEVARTVTQNDWHRVEMFCSDGARKHDIYGKAFREFGVDVEIEYPCSRRQEDVTRTICAVKTKSRFENEPKSLLEKLIHEASSPVVLGCTDLRVAYAVDDALPANVVDSLECLADAIVRMKEEMHDKC